MAAVAGVGGLTHLYNRNPQVLEILPQIDLSDIMKEYRCKQLIENIHFAFHGEDVTDPWNPVLGLINGFNNNRAQKVAASHLKLFDELMSSWSPTTSKWGGLLFILFILRKPKPLGTEFKCVACSESGELKLTPTLPWTPLARRRPMPSPPRAPREAWEIPRWG